MTDNTPTARPDALRLATQYAALPEDKRALFRARARSQGIDTSALPAVPLAPRPARFPLLPAQERLWFLWCLDPNHAGYHLTQTLRLSGRFDAAALRRAFGALLARHEALRLRFEAGDGVPMQVPGPVPAEADGAAGGAFTLRQVGRDPAALAAALHGFACAPFDLSGGLPIRVGVFEVAPDQRVLQIVVHHIVADAWSMELLLRDLLAFYRGQTPAPLPLQFADVAMWRREWLAADELDAQLAHWRAVLDGAPGAITLPRDLPPRPQRSHDGGTVRRTLDAPLAGRLRAIAREQGTTPFTLLLAAYGVLLGRYAAQRTVLIGVPSAGRERRETEALVGFFVNTLIVRADLDGAQRFDALLRALHARVLDAQAHREVPFARLVEALAVERDLDSSPLFQVMFDLAVDQARGPLALPDGLLAEPLGDAAVTARFDLALNGRDRGAGGGVELALTYARDRFVEASVARLLDDYTALLAQIAADPARRVADLAAPRAREAARREIARAPFQPAHRRIAERAARCPARVALRCEGAELGYGELDGWAARIGAALRGDGLAPGERVGLLLNRSLALPAALLGVWHAGGAFVPLDPEYPPARLRAMIADAGVRRVIVDDGTRARWPDLLAPLRAIDAWQPRAEPAAHWPGASGGPAAPLHPEALAYVIYTSGSTGTPKGVAISHGALALHLDDFLHDHRITETDVVLQSSTINFDVALHELLPALIAGARVVMRGPLAWELDTLNRTLIDERVTFARIPTALWQQWRIALPAPEALALRQITVGGEGLPGDALAKWLDGPLARVAIDNLYGPTETTVAALHHPVGPADAASAIVAIGRCYPSRHAYVADLDGNRAPDGALGELCIGGATLAHGYLGRPELTAERFVPDPTGAPGSRVYRSGDLCRARPDGTIDFLGRLDQQIKLRGHRIELGEIETALRRAAGVREGVVDLRGAGERKRLVAYFTGTAAPEAVREALAATLPASHVPSLCVALAALPTLPNGKLDRRALPEPDDTVAGRAVPPDGPLETTLLAIWQTVLGRRDFGVTDAFFALGGDSISSLRVIAQARAAGWIVSARQVFEHPSVRALARVAQRADAAPGEGAAAGPQDGPPDDPQDGPQDAPLVPMQQWFFEQFPDAPSRWNQSVLLTSAEPLEAAALRGAFAALLATHDALRVRFVRDPAGAAWTQTIAPPSASAALAEAAFESIDLRAAGSDAGAWRAALARQAERLHGSLDLAAGPLIRAAAMATPDGARLLIVAHHLVMDGVSWRILLDDLLSAYDAARAAPAGAPPALPRPATGWADWSRRLAAYARQPELLSELAWWQARLGTAPAAAPRAEGGQRHRAWALDAAATACLTDAGWRIDDVLLAALAHACAQVLPELPVIVELEGHGRGERVPGVDLSRTVGWFTTQYPLRIEARETAGATRRAIAAARAELPADGLHYNLLRYAGLASSRAALAALPATTVGFNYLGRFDERLGAGRFGFAAEDSGDGTLGRAARGPRHWLDLNGLIADGRLKVDWSAAERAVDEARLARLIAAFDAQVRALADAAARSAPGGEAAPAAPRGFGGLPAGAMPAAVAGANPAAEAAFAVWRERFYTEARLAPSPDPLRQPLNAAHAAVTLFCCYPGFGLTGEYRFLAAALQGVASVVALRAPGFALPDSTPADWPASFDALADAATRSVLDAQPRGPYRLLGWSFGGRLAFTVAARLRALGHEVDFVGLLDTAVRTADAHEAGPAADAGPAGARDALPGWLDAQPDGALLRPLFARAAEIDALHYRLRLDHALPRLDVPVTFWQASRDAVAGRDRDWRPYTSAGVTLLEADATHSGIVLHPAVHDELARRLRALAAPADGAASAARSHREAAAAAQIVRDDARQG
ncbi:non-ribosomal peptide synthetase [Burkholderia glumae]|uniref:Non-ribosomal peptide synthetase n=4 Tax=Burkholderia glumae TaxID=337 RepID=A0ABY5BBL2_BURGL|nr:non-ribosomal peptide synthetase [Burkholderia glumae]ACR31380.1 peptide synthase [Burkholderia glumae BGR1]MCM2485462.1 non-ribosomal peptide synthetase [Burkholderia glumae]MCM2511156.1 non-ribosomal peptide synthetase [Burkholderia glumae]MCM2541034.1 non-ribosomal peptide synthetase [Burkholderia glumae]QKM56753.1 Linear gramicidin synthase subunit D [Burkholderia glumae]